MKGKGHDGWSRRSVNSQNGGILVTSEAPKRPKWPRPKKQIHVTINIATSKHHAPSLLFISFIIFWGVLLQDLYILLLHLLVHKNFYHFYHHLFNFIFMTTSIITPYQTPYMHTLVQLFDLPIYVHLYDHLHHHRYRMVQKYERELYVKGRLFGEG